MLLSTMFSQNERAPLWIVESITQTVARFNGSQHEESWIDARPIEGVATAGCLS